MTRSAGCDVWLLMMASFAVRSLVVMFHFHKAHMNHTGALMNSYCYICTRRVTDLSVMISLELEEHSQDVETDRTGGKHIADTRKEILVPTKLGDWWALASRSCFQFSVTAYCCC